MFCTGTYFYPQFKKLNDDCLFNSGSSIRKSYFQLLLINLSCQFCQTWVIEVGLLDFILPSHRFHFTIVVYNAIKNYSVLKLCVAVLSFMYLLFFNIVNETTAVAVFEIGFILQQKRQSRLQLTSLPEGASVECATDFLSQATDFDCNPCEVGGKQECLGKSPLNDNWDSVCQLGSCSFMC